MVNFFLQYEIIQWGCCSTHPRSDHRDHEEVEKSLWKWMQFYFHCVKKSFHDWSRRIADFWVTIIDQTLINKSRDTHNLHSWWPTFRETAKESSGKLKRPINLTKKNHECPISRTWARGGIWSGLSRSHFHHLPVKLLPLHMSFL